MMRKIVLFLILFISMFWKVTSQVDTFTKQVIDGVIIYKDIKKPLLYYYAPSKLQLVIDEVGRPDFQILKMRYVGTQCSNDADKSHVTNIVKLRIEIPPQTNSILAKIKKKLSVRKSITLKPILITGIDSRLMVPAKSLDSVQKMQNLGTTNTTASADNKGLSSKKSYWTERVFTFSLDRRETELLVSQLKDNTLALSFSYSFFTNATDPLAYQELIGSSELVELVEDSKDDDEIKLVNKVIFSDAFKIDISLDKWPDLIKEIDINESIPPTYAAIEVKCFDFCENLRPNLYIKKVEVAATSVDGRKEIIVETKFHKKYTDINTKYIHFPYAILIGKPMKYRLTEITDDGQIIVSEWEDIESCSSILDITTPADKLTSKKINYEIEIDESWFVEDNTTLLVKLSYVLNKEIRSNLLEFYKDDLYKEVSFYGDIGYEVIYDINVQTNDSIIYRSDKSILNDSYLYVAKK